jgi:glutathione peroxidase
MKKYIFAVCLGMFALIPHESFAQKKPAAAQNTISLPKKQKMHESIYTIKVVDITGEKFDMSSLREKKVLIVNTASKCGLTPQYKELEKLYHDYKDHNFVILGFPANNFAEQEPGDNSEIMQFCERNYGVTFPMMSKISVQGDDMHELYKFLTSATPKSGEKIKGVQWNFQKYLIGRDGTVDMVVGSKTSPLSEEIINWIKE